MTGRQLIKAAKEAQAFSYSPYSGFKVGAALLCKSGKVYTGCNIENASFSATVCAERTALFKAVSEGEREFSAMAIVGNTDLCFPCGVCRQVMSEFCGKNFKIYLEENGKPVTYALGELLPGRFDFKK
ncbi:MAG: cytidine deaminase [Clostridia bacterium]|jgi:cytidine deaminase, homotetrameric|nr:cytidine deaminase [Clostridia bacterium]